MAETNPALATLENSDLLRRFGLILVNADGFDPSRGFVIRGTQNVQALANSMTPQDPSIRHRLQHNGRNPNPPERLGWGNDGAPLRDFALVAIAQHAPMTMSRTPGVDFRVPTDEELDALAAYQLALGRQEDFDLPTLELKSALASHGKTLFLDSGNLFEPGHKNCNACHFNGGGTAGMSFNDDSRISASRRQSAWVQHRVPDERERDPAGARAWACRATVASDRSRRCSDRSATRTILPPPFGHVEIEEFNSPPLVESADTAPFFHNHTVPDLESAVAFYGTQAFKSSLIPAVIPVDISEDPADPEVQAIAAFLRVLNALENIRSSINVAKRGRTMNSVADMRDLARLSLAEAVDAFEVLSAGALNKIGEPAIRSARVKLAVAKVALDVAQHLRVSKAIDNLLSLAIQQLREARSALAKPGTLPASFQN